MTGSDLRFDTSKMYQVDYPATVKKDLSSQNNITILNKSRIGTDYSYKHKVVWENVFGFLILHILGLCGFYALFTGANKFYTLIWGIFITYCNAIGVTVGAHRYFTHNSYKASSFLRAVLIIFQTSASQNPMFVWVRDHRMHHRYSDTDADPHNAKRGFFFCHMGWLMTKKHPLVIQLGKEIDLADLKADWMVMFQKKYYFYLYLILAILIPVSVPVYYFGESFRNSILICFFSRIIFVMHNTWLVNSVAHLYGPRPYDKNMQPVESLIVSILTLGEGWHNYHHAYPWDYKAAEQIHINHSATVIKFFEKIGLAWDLKAAAPKLVETRRNRTGDGSHFALRDNKTLSSATSAFESLHSLISSTSDALEPEVSSFYNETTNVPRRLG